MVGRQALYLGTFCRGKPIELKDLAPMCIHVHVDNVGRFLETVRDLRVGILEILLGWMAGCQSNFGKGLEDANVVGASEYGNNMVLFKFPSLCFLVEV